MPHEDDQLPRVPGYVPFEDPWPSRGEALAVASVVAERAKKLYGDHLDRVLLYGSRARGDHHPESDLDVLLVKKSDDYDPDGLLERQLHDFFLIGRPDSPMWVMVSIRAASIEQVDTWDTTFFRNVRADAVVVE